MRILERLDELAALGDRIGYSPEEDAAHELAAFWFREAGLEVEVDAAGNLIGRIPGGGRQVWTGSHLDTVPGAGRFDGALGVVAGLEAVEALGLPGLGVVVFRDEERGCAGSRACVATGVRARRLRRAAHRAGPDAPPRRGAARRRDRDRRLRARPPQLHGHGGARRHDADGGTRGRARRSGRVRAAGAGGRARDRGRRRDGRAALRRARRHERRSPASSA